MFKLYKYQYKRVIHEKTEKNNEKRQQRYQRKNEEVKRVFVEASKYARIQHARSAM